MRNEFTAIVEKDVPWYIAYCAEVTGANGQGKSREECLSNLRQAILPILEHRREESLRYRPHLMPDTNSLSSDEARTARPTLRRHGCVLRREGKEHTLWENPQTGHAEAVPRQSEIANLVPNSAICRFPTHRDELEQSRTEILSSDAR
jgi:predicted RNase H-like HicB family nuclease